MPFSAQSNVTPSRFSIISKPFGIICIFVFLFSSDKELNTVEFKVPVLGLKYSLELDVFATDNVPVVTVESVTYLLAFVVVSSVIVTPPELNEMFAEDVIRPYVSTVITGICVEPPNVPAVAAVVAKPKATVPVAALAVICPVLPYTDVPAGIEIDVFAIEEILPLAATTTTGMAEEPP